MNSPGTFWKVLGCTGELHVLPVPGLVFISICAAAALREPFMSSQHNNCVWQSSWWQPGMQMGQPGHILPGIPAWNPCPSPCMLIKPLLSLALGNKIALEVITVITLSEFSTEWFCCTQEPEVSPHRLHCIFGSLLPVQMFPRDWQGHKIRSKSLFNLCGW